MTDPRTFPCRGCGAPMYWAKHHETGSAMPLSVNSYAVTGENEVRWILDLNSTSNECRLAQPGEMGYLSHFAAGREGRMSDDCQHVWVSNSGSGGEPRFKPNRQLYQGERMHVECRECGARTWVSPERWAALWRHGSGAKFKRESDSCPERAAFRRKG